MPQLVLDPGDDSVAGTFPQTTLFPPKIRDFGRFIDVSELLPGDVILFADVNPRWLGKCIISTQRELGFAVEDARWTHAAIYVGEHHVCESVLLSGVRYHHLYGYIGKRLIRVRRDISLTRDQRYKIVIQAMTSLRESYGYWNALRIGWGALTGISVVSRSVVPFYANSVVCSQLFAVAYGAVTCKMLDTKVSHFTPAHLSATTNLSDVAVKWFEVRP